MLWPCTFASLCWLALAEIFSYSYTYNLIAGPGPRLGITSDVWPFVAQGTIVHGLAELAREERRETEGEG